MKAKIHPKYYVDAQITCACGNTFTSGATFPELKVEICYACHPFYTGNMKFVDTAGRVDAFRAKMAGTTAHVKKSDKRKAKKMKKLQEELSRPETLAALREQV